MFAGHLGAALVAKSVEPRPSLGVYVAAAYRARHVVAGLPPRRRRERADPAWRNPVHASRVRQLSLEPQPRDERGLGRSGRTRDDAIRERTVSRLSPSDSSSSVIGFWIGSLTSRILPVWPGGPLEGLGLWRSTTATLVVEGAFFLAAIAAYVRRTRARDAAGRWAFWGLVVLVTLIWVSGPFSPPPPSVGAIIVVGDRRRACSFPHGRRTSIGIVSTRPLKPSALDSCRVRRYCPTGHPPHGKSPDVTCVPDQEHL